MQITTTEEARALVGRTFERDGRRRTVFRSEAWNDRPGWKLQDRWIIGWRRGDGTGGHESLRKFNQWLRKATETPDA